MKMEWIKLEDKKPLENIKLLGYFPDGDGTGLNVSTAIFNGYKLRSDFPNSTAFCFEATHWMYLPLIPIIKDEEGPFVLAPYEWFKNWVRHHNPKIQMLGRVFYVKNDKDKMIKYILEDILHPRGDSYILSKCGKSFVWNYQNNKTIFIKECEAQF